MEHATGMGDDPNGGRPPDPFREHVGRYEARFEANRNAYLAEVRAVRSLLPPVTRRVEIGVGTGRFAAPLGIAFIELDATMEGMEIVAQDRIRGNLVKPPIWTAALNTATSSLPREGPGILVFGSALNLLLFSPSYGESILAEIKATIARTENLTFLFSVSSSAKKEMISELEGVADNLLIAHASRDPFRLSLRIERMKRVPFRPGEVEVPISEETLEEIKAVADHSRRRVVPLISDI